MIGHVRDNDGARLSSWWGWWFLKNDLKSDPYELSEQFKKQKGENFEKMTLVATVLLNFWVLHCKFTKFKYFKNFSWNQLYKFPKSWYFIYVKWKNVSFFSWNQLNMNFCSTGKLWFDINSDLGSSKLHKNQFCTFWSCQIFNLPNFKV